MNRLKYRYCGTDQLYDLTDKGKCRDIHVEYMLNRSQAMFSYKGLPDTIPEWLFKRILMTYGFVCITKVKGELYAFFGGLGGEPNAYYQPTICTVANPYLEFSANLKIGTDCEIVKNDYYYMGLIPMFNRYASGLVENELSMNIVVILSRVHDLITADNDKDKENANNFLSNIINGKLSTIASSAFLDGIKTQPYGNGATSSGIKDLIEYEEYLKGAWYNDIGIKYNVNMKREALNSSETSVNDLSLLPFIDIMYECQKADLEKVNALYGTNISIEYNSAWEIQREKVKNVLE